MEAVFYEYLQFHVSLIERFRFNLIVYKLNCWFVLYLIAVMRERKTDQLAEDFLERKIFYRMNCGIFYINFYLTEIKCVFS